MVPSLVTWPTMMTAVPLDLAKRTSSAVHSRSCDTAPAAAPAVEACTVCIESITNSCARRSPASARMAASSVSATTATPAAPSDSRCARRLTCATDSSPLAYTTAHEWATKSATCNSSVDLPMPGSPPSRITEPGTIPPPSTRSSSCAPLATRVAAAASATPALSATAPSRRRRAARPRRFSARANSTRHTTGTAPAISGSRPRRKSHTRTWDLPRAIGAAFKSDFSARIRGTVGAERRLL